MTDYFLVRPYEGDVMGPFGSPEEARSALAATDLCDLCYTAHRQEHLSALHTRCGEEWCLFSRQELEEFEAKQSGPTA